MSQLQVGYPALPRVRGTPGQARSAWPERARIARPGESCWQVGVAKRVSFLVDAASYFSALGAALARAERSIFILGWDIHSRVRLGHGARGREIGALLCELVKRRPRLHVQVLDWDYSFLMIPTRELAPWWRLDWGAARRLRFLMDSRHPVGGCHHQKLVVIDDALAFVGGIDITANRWDTPEHRVDEPRRRNPWGRPYAPVHDVQAAVDGEAAALLGQLARERWRRAGGEALPPQSADSGADPRDVWPPKLHPDLGPAQVAIARTEPAYAGRRAVQEIEVLYRATIARARHSIYIENQYLSSRAVGDALCASLAARRGPEIAIVSPRACAGWLEEGTMGLLRRRLAGRLRAADRHGRLRLLVPRLPGERRCLHVHSKLMIVDAECVRIGSANLSNRSMGLDTECDIQIEAAGDAGVAAGIRALRDRLLAEHLGASPARVSQVLLARGDRLFAALDELGGGERTLAPLETRLPEWIDRIVPYAWTDPERPFESFRRLEAWSPELLRDPHRRRLGPLLAAAGVAALACAWRGSLPTRRESSWLLAAVAGVVGCRFGWLRRRANLQSDCKPCQAIPVPEAAQSDEPARIMQSA